MVLILVGTRSPVGAGRMLTVEVAGHMLTVEVVDRMPGAGLVADHKLEAVRRVVGHRLMVKLVGRHMLKAGQVGHRRPMAGHSFIMVQLLAERIAAVVADIAVVVVEGIAAVVMRSYNVADSLVSHKYLAASSLVGPLVASWARPLAKHT